MNDERKIPAEQIVDRAASALRETPVPAGPPAETMQAVLAAGEAAGKPLKLKTFRERIFAMNRFAKIAAAVLICAAVAGLAIWLGTPESVAWADVQEKIRKAHTLTCTISMRQEGAPAVEGKMFIKEPGLIRQELTEPEPAILIFDLKKGKLLTLAPKEKKAILIDITGLPGQIRKGHEGKDFLAKLKALVEGAESELGEREIAGKKAKGYKIKHKGEGLTLWVNAKTGDILEMELKPFQGKMVMVLSDFVLDKPLDEKLFSLEKPKGYDWISEPLKLYEGAAEDVAGALRTWAKMRGGSFPDAVTPQEMVKDITKAGPPPSDEVALKMGILAGRTFLLLANKDRKCCYAGKGVKSGDAETAIFWFLPKDGKTYKVIYGDLSIKEVAEEDLPEAPKEEKPDEAEADKAASKEAESEEEPSE